MVRQGFRVAQLRDERGIDLIIYLHARDEGPDLRAAHPVWTSPFWLTVPLQLKIAVEADFDRGERPVARAYARDLVVVYIRMSAGTPQFFLLSDAETRRIESATPGVSVAQLRPFEDHWEWLRARLTGQAAG